MTENERSQIVALQYKGYGYKRIAAETGLALNTVKSFCARHPVQSKKRRNKAIYAVIAGTRLNRHRTSEKRCIAPIAAE